MRPFRGPDGQILPGSIARLGFVPLGGPDQWVMIRGEDVANHALIPLHGGPGFSETRLFRHFNAPLERAFTVIYWNQRHEPFVDEPKKFNGSMIELVRPIAH